MCLKIFIFFKYVVLSDLFPPEICLGIRFPVKGILLTERHLYKYAPSSTDSHRGKNKCDGGSDGAWGESTCLH